MTGVGARCGEAVAGEACGMESCQGEVYGKGMVGWRCGACGNAGGDVGNWAIGGHVCCGKCSIVAGMWGTMDGQCGCVCGIGKVGAVVGGG